MVGSMVVRLKSTGGAIMAVHGANQFVTSLAFCGLLGACAVGSNRLIGHDIESFCTLENGYRQGVEGIEYAGACPELLAPAFLDGYQSGYAVHLAELEIDAMERAIHAMSSDLNEIWSALDAVSQRLQTTDATSAEQAQWRTETSQLAARRDRLTGELDELEVAFRKTQLLQMRHAVAAID
jgi:Protein of unknown function (DUF2799)